MRLTGSSSLLSLVETQTGGKAKLAGLAKILDAVLLASATEKDEDPPEYNFEANPKKDRPALSPQKVTPSHR